MKRSHTRHSPRDANQSHESLSRRRFLKGVGACIALPMFESILPSPLRAAALSGTGSFATTATGAPLRMAFACFPNGAIHDAWWPTGESKNYELGRTMASLESMKDKIQVIKGLDHENATPGNDGGGDHARANATLLTGARARKTIGSDIQLGVSIDQLVAKQIGHQTRFPSLELSCDSVRKSGHCDTGYSCAYQYNLSWQSATTPMTPEPNPRFAFERLFGSGSPDQRQANFQRRLKTQNSLLDFALDDARSLQSDLDYNDKQKLDEYLTGVREIERRIEQAERFGELPNPDSDTPAGIPEDYGVHMDTMYDILALAFQTDSTRVATLMLAHDGSNRVFPQIGIPEGHHHCTHHRNDDDLVNKVERIDAYYVQRFARFIEKLDTIKDVDGNSVLHNSMIVYGCGNSDGNRHTHSDLPVVLAGSAGGSIDTGRYLELSSQPMTNLYLSMADRLGIQDLDRFGDSTGRAMGF